MRIKSSKPVLVEIDMTPMIDIVFQLIAFFMLITNFEQTQADERVKLPSDQLAMPLEVARVKQLTLNIGFIRDKAGNRRSEAFVFYAGEEIPVLSMGKWLDKEARLYKQEGTDLKDVTIVFRADKQTPTGLVQELMSLSQSAGFEKFSWSALQKIDP
ncbi:MAG: biopolymer transporter ExbD [Planctomycetes bacterium]|nr:biopolymer transporter ExbD [Planctomycetota bacterium]